MVIGRFASSSLSSPRATVKRMTTPVPNIDLPAELRPGDGRFGSGPSKVRPEAVTALAAAAPTYLGTSHRQATVKSVVRRLREGLTQLFSLPGGYEVVLGNGGTAAFWGAAAERIARIKASGRWAPAFLDLSIAVENSRLDQTYNTPALATLFLMVNQLEWILEQGGLDWSTSRCDRSADIVYGWAEASAYATPFVADKGDRSHVVATIDLDPALDAATVAKVLRANGIVDTESYRKLGRNQLRIAMFVAIEPDDLATLTRAIDYIADRLAA